MKYKVNLKNEKSFIPVRHYTKLFDSKKEASEWAQERVNKNFARPNEFEIEIVEVK